MSKKIAFLFPGQGAQYVGMGRDFYEAFPLAKHTFQEADDLLGRHLSSLIFNGPASELTLTKNSQVAIYVVSIAIWRVLKEQFPSLQPTITAGLSLGEYTALTAAEKITFEECLPLVQARADFMNAACETTVGSMQVVLGLDAEAVEKVISSLNPSHSVWVANLNCPGQVVIAGTPSSLEHAAIALKEAGAKRALPLEVSGAFHSGLMQPAKEKLTPYIDAVSIKETPIELVMNVPGQGVRSPTAIKNYLIEQVTNPVRWEKGIRYMMQIPVDLYIEIGCGKTLVGMNKRIGVTTSSVSIEKVQELEEIRKGE